MHLLFSSIWQYSTCTFLTRRERWYSIRNGWEKSTHPWTKTKYYLLIFIWIKSVSHVTLFEIFIFCPKIQLWFPEKIVDISGWKTRENVVVLDILTVDNFDFTRKLSKKTFGWKTRENVGGVVKTEFMDEKLTFQIVSSISSHNLIFLLTWTDHIHNRSLSV